MLKNEFTRYAERRRRITELCALFLFTFILAVSVLRAVNQTLLFTVRVEGSSMSPTLKNGDVLIVSRTAEITRGSIVVVETEEGTSVIKRVIALPGETVWSVRGTVHISGPDGNFILAEDYVLPDNAGGADVVRTELAEGYVFLLGDNRAVSLDSRVFGPLKISSVQGVVTDFWLEHKL